MMKNRKQNDGKIAHGNDVSLQVGFTVQRSRYKELTFWSEDETVAGTRNMSRTPGVTVTLPLLSDLLSVLIFLCRECIQDVCMCPILHRPTRYRLIMPILM